MDGYDVQTKPVSAETPRARPKRLTLAGVLAIATAGSILISGLNALVQIVKVAIELAR